MQTVHSFFSEGFFGYGETGDFQYGSLSHFIPIVLLAAAVFLTARYGKKIAAWKHEGSLRFLLAFVAIIVEMSYFWRLLYVGDPGSDTLLQCLPFQVCQWTLILSCFMLMSRNRFLFGMCYFNALVFCTLALATPAVISTTGPTYYRYYQFFLEHGLPIYFVFYMMFVWGFRPKLNDIPKPLCQLLPLAAISAVLNPRIEGANYMYLASDTDSFSMANLFPASIPLRVVIYAAVALLLFFLAYLPYYIRDHRKPTAGGKGSSAE